MTLVATYKKHVSDFITPGGTSRGVLLQKDSYIIELIDDKTPTVKGLGEVSLINNLSIDAVSEIEQVMDFVCKNIIFFTLNNVQLLDKFPAVRFGLEMALLDLKNGGKQFYFESDFTKGKACIPINGLIWMGDIGFMMKQIQEKMEQKYSCLKLKIGANSFDSELTLLTEIRKSFSPSELEIRLDANGAFSHELALNRLDALSQFAIHSIEQPIKQGNWSTMADICIHSPIKIVLDEELIGVTNLVAQEQLLQTIKPHYIILKPSLLGGFVACEEWITMAKNQNIDYWITSALETNIGLNAIAQWCYTLGITLAQGLGTGKLFSNNFDSPLYLKGDKLYFKRDN